jgi:hypothetical protein
MTLPLSEPKYYFLEGFYWQVTENGLLQFDENFCNPWKPGTKMYEWKRRQLSVIRPIHHSEGEYVLDLLIKYLEGIRTSQKDNKQFMENPVL